MIMPSTAELEHGTLTVEDFIAFLDKRGTGENWLLLDGTPVMIVGGSREHSLIAGNIFAALRAVAKQQGAEAHVFDMLVSNPDDPLFAAAPDVFVRRGPAQRAQRKIHDPILVVEVLSPSTMAIDRGYKFTRYSAIPSLQQILFVYQDEPRVESWTRGEPVWALKIAQGADSSVDLEDFGSSLPLSTVYDGITW
jgi:Uma2 family endonuclease